MTTLRARNERLATSACSGFAALAFVALSGAAGDASDASALFAEHCAECHGTSGGGIEGVGPNLLDDDWIWGGDERAILLTIAHGVRSDDPLSRRAEMPSFGVDGLLDVDEIAAVATYLRAVSTGESPDDAGAELYADYCATCHGEALEGQIAGGAPRLSDGVWLYGGTMDEIAAQIADPRHGEMPAWIAELGPEAVRLLTDYVIGLGAAR